MTVRLKTAPYFSEKQGKMNVNPYSNNINFKGIMHICTMVPHPECEDFMIPNNSIIETTKAEDDSFVKEIDNLLGDELVQLKLTRRTSKKLFTIINNITEPREINSYWTKLYSPITTISRESKDKIVYDDMDIHRHNGSFPGMSVKLDLRKQAEIRENVEGLIAHIKDRDYVSDRHLDEINKIDSGLKAGTLTNVELAQAELDLLNTPEEWDPNDMPF